MKLDRSFATKSPWPKVPANQTRGSRNAAPEGQPTGTESPTRQAKHTVSSRIRNAHDLYFPQIPNLLNGRYLWRQPAPARQRNIRAARPFAEAHSSRTRKAKRYGMESPRQMIGEGPAKVSSRPGQGGRSRSESSIERAALTKAGRRLLDEWSGTISQHPEGQPACTAWARVRVGACWRLVAPRNRCFEGARVDQHEFRQHQIQELDRCRWPQVARYSTPFESGDRAVLHHRITAPHSVTLYRQVDGKDRASWALGKFGRQCCWQRSLFLFQHRIFGGCPICRWAPAALSTACLFGIPGLSSSRPKGGFQLAGVS